MDTSILPTLRLDSTESLLAIVERLNAFQPDILVAYAETAYALALKQLGHDLHISPRGPFRHPLLFRFCPHVRGGAAALERQEQEPTREDDAENRTDTEVALEPCARAAVAAVLELHDGLG